MIQKIYKRTNKDFILINTSTIEISDKFLADDKHNVFAHVNFKLFGQDYYAVIGPANCVGRVKIAKDSLLKLVNAINYKYDYNIFDIQRSDDDVLRILNYDR